MRLALFQPDIPQNVGAAIRLTACLGVDLDIVEPCGFPLGDAALRRAALDYGTIARVTRHDSWPDFLSRPERVGRRLVLLTTSGETLLPEARFEPNDTLIMGAESRGAPEFVHRASSMRVRIPIVNGARSLNIVTSAALALGEALRQTGGYPAQATTRRADPGG